MLYIRPDPLHTWYATFTTCQTLRMWTTLFNKCDVESDRVLALRALVYFAQPPDKEKLKNRNEFTKQDALLEILREEIKQGRNLRIEDFLKSRKRKAGSESKQIDISTIKDDRKLASMLQIPDTVYRVENGKKITYKEAAKKRMMKYRQRIKHRQQEQDLNPDEGPIDVFESCFYNDESMCGLLSLLTDRSIVQEAILACVFWQKFSEEDKREKCIDLGKKKLLETFKAFFMYEDGSIYPVLYDESCVMRRALVSSIALLRDKEEYVSIMPHT